MFSNANRLKNKKDFNSLFSGGKSLKTPSFILKAKNNNLQKNRFGFVVSQKVSKKATIRNKIRRRLVAAVKGETGKLGLGIDLAFIALPGAEKKDFKQIKQDVSEAIKCLIQ